MSDDVRSIRVSRDFVEHAFVRAGDGRALSIDWGEPDAEGFYDPVFTATDDGWRAAIEAEAAAQERGRWVAVVVALGYGVDIAQAWRREPHGWPDVRSAIEDLCEELGQDAAPVLALLEGDDAS